MANVKLRPALRLLDTTIKESVRQNSSILQKIAFRESGGKFTVSKWRKARGLENYPEKLDREIIGVIKNLEVLKDEITYEAVKIAAKAAIDVLRLSQHYVPYDTGELKQSGIAMLNLGQTIGGGFRVLTIARGNRMWNDDNVSTDLRKISPKKIKEMRGRSATLIVSYQREGLKGEDIALWTHEDLNPYGSWARPRARMPGTGPKYIEKAFRKFRGRYLSDMKNVPLNVKNALIKIRKVQKSAKTRYEVETARLLRRS